MNQNRPEPNAPPYTKMVHTETSQETMPMPQGQPAPAPPPQMGQQHPMNQVHGQIPIGYPVMGQPVPMNATGGPPQSGQPAINGTMPAPAYSPMVPSQPTNQNQNNNNVNVNIVHPGVIFESRPCCGLGLGWGLFIFGFFFLIPWYIGACYLFCIKTTDSRDRPGHIASAVAAGISTIAIIISASKGSTM